MYVYGVGGKCLLIPGSWKYIPDSSPSPHVKEIEETDIWKR